MRRFWIAFVSCLTHASLCQALPVTFNFIAEVTAVSNSSVFQCPSQPLAPCRAGPSGMIVGDLFEGSFTFDSDAAGIALSDGTVVYSFSGMANEVVVLVNSIIVFDAFDITVRNDAPFFTPDEYGLITPDNGSPSGPVNHLEIELGATDSSALPSDALPLVPPDLVSFVFARGSLSIRTTPNIRESLSFNVTSLVVPEPGTLLLLASGLLVLAVRNRYRPIRRSD